MPRNNGPLEDALDDAIDQTLRTLVCVDPPDRLVARVMARIAAANAPRIDREPTRVIGRWPLAAALAAAAAIVFAIALTLTMRPRPVVVERTARETTHATPSPPPRKPEPETNQAAQATPPSPRVNRPSATLVVHRTIAAAPPLEPSIAIAKLDPPSPIEIDDIAAKPIAIDVLAIPRLEIEPIEMSGRDW